MVATPNSAEEASDSTEESRSSSERVPNSAERDFKLNLAEPTPNCAETTSKSLRRLQTSLPTPYHLTRTRFNVRGGHSESRARDFDLC